MSLVQDYLEKTISFKYVSPGITGLHIFPFPGTGGDTVSGITLSATIHREPFRIHSSENQIFFYLSLILNFLFSCCRDWFHTCNRYFFQSVSFILLLQKLSQSNQQGSIFRADTFARLSLNQVDETLYRTLPIPLRNLFLRSIQFL
jgi:hypothetical protein